MRNKRSERGFVFLSLTGIIVFSFVAMTLLTATLARTAFLARQSHRLTLQKQAEWLAEGAVERALVTLSSAPDPSKIGEQTFTTRLAPVFIDSDPLSEIEGDQPSWDRSITASYGFSVLPADDFPNLENVADNAKARFLIIGHADVPWRDTTLTRSATNLCSLNQDGSWTVIPIAQ